MRIGIDLDGVVANFNLGWMRRYNAEFGANLDDTMVDHWDAAADLTHFGDLHGFWRWARPHDGQPSFFRNLDTYPGALDALNHLAVNHHLVILTMKPGWAVHDTFAWIADQRIPTREVHMLRDKWKVDCDVYLDDSPRVVPPLVEHRPDAVVCRFVRPWNHPITGAIDIHGWPEFVRMVNRVTDTRTRKPEQVDWAAPSAIAILEKR